MAHANSKPPSSAARACVHPDAAAGCPRNGARELEAAELGRTRAMQHHGVRRAAAGADEVALNLDAGQVAGQLEDERVDTVVGDEQVRSEPDGRDGEPALARPAQGVL